MTRNEFFDKIATFAFTVPIQLHKTDGTKTEPLVRNELMLRPEGISFVRKGGTTIIRYEDISDIRPFEGADGMVIRRLH